AAIDVIRRAYPEHRILAEESGERQAGEAPARRGRAAQDDTRWIIDPLDGTTNFIHGFPQYCVSIAVEQRGRVAHAVVYDPTKNELFTASQGRGAFLNDRRIRVTKCAHMREALVGTGFPFKELSRIDRYLRDLETIMRGSAGIRRAGAAALDLAYVACGRLDAFWEMGLAPWDMAAGALLISEAGGLVGDLQGGKDFMASGDIAAATPKVFPELLDALR
ncbi:MAG TPA: inositol monophosphatase family protein, partial [Burkholderiales bacterium]|nr:inositol monophosphatase family protein [Burkholderiales bacterium]